MKTATEPREHPILFTDEMVRAILAGRKTQTRRAMKEQPKCFADEARCVNGVWYWWQGGQEVGVIGKCPFGEVGSGLWVREAWTECLHTSPATDEPVPVANGDRLIEPATFRIDGNGRKRWNYDGRVICYRATSDVEFCDGDGFSGELADRSDMPRWRPSIHMPRWASRLTLEVTDVRVQRLQEISEADAIAEAAEKLKHDDIGWWSHRRGFETLWESINGKGSWAANPWVWAITFRKLEAK